MIRLLGGGLGFMVRRVVRFLNRSVSLAMGCFFGCFRIRDDRSRPQIVAKSTPPVRPVSRNRLSALFIDEEKGESAFKITEGGDSGSPQIEKSLKEEWENPHGQEKGLVKALYSDEASPPIANWFWVGCFNMVLEPKAKFLKACGTIPETPSELRKKSNKLKQSPPCHGDSESPKFRSWMPHASINRVQTDQQSDQSSTPTKPCEDRQKESASLDETPGSGQSAAMDADPLSISSTEDKNAMNVYKAARFPLKQTNDATLDSPWPSSLNIQGKNKSVHFEFDIDASSKCSENVTQDANQSDSPTNQSVSKPSPNPTPLKLSDEMQTPGTVYRTNLEILVNKKTRIRSQYVYTVQNPVENVPQFSSKEVLNESNESAEWQESVTSLAEKQAKQALGDKEVKMEESLISWLKPKTYHNNDQDAQDTSKTPHIRRNLIDRPIIGMVAAHWNENEPTQVSPKWWDGNGIPNSTNKYKEDQKVSWHATPFEERLEKALSEETHISQRKQLSGPSMVFEENEESDTALSQLRPSTHSKSVVSF